MPPYLALLVWLILLVALLRFDPAKEAETSWALWVPVAWIFIVATRLPSQWLGLEVVTIEAQAFQEGNPVDRAVWLLLILLAITILVSRSFNWTSFFGRNLALTAFLSFALLSVVWSGFPFIAFKRWFRDLGGYLVILVVLTDPHPLEAVRTVLRRLGYLLIPLSVVLIKYFPRVSRQYDGWTGLVQYVGPTTSKNMLGVLCMVSGVFFFWDMVSRWSAHKEPRTKRIILVDLAFIAMTLWVMHDAHSATSGVCLVIGCLMILAAHSNLGKRHPGLLKTLAPGTFFFYLTVAFGLGFSGALNHFVGRKANFTDRTDIWKALLSMHTNPLVGVGYQSFWLGPRLQSFWQMAGVGHINEAHNGYLEIYLELGIIGLFLLCAFLVASYRTICKRLKPFTSFGSLSLALWTILLFYNFTEAAIGPSLLWVVFLLAAMAVPEVARSRPHRVLSFDMGEVEEVPSSPYEVVSQGR